MKNYNLFTNGEWIVLRPDDSTPWTRVFSNKSDFMIVEAYGNDVTEAEANAKLCAAAPDLLKAAERLFIDAEERGETRDENTGELFDDWQELYNAIQKASYEHI